MSNKGTQRHDDDCILYAIFYLSSFKYGVNRHFPDFPLQILLDMRYLLVI